MSISINCDKSASYLQKITSRCADDVKPMSGTKFFHALEKNYGLETVQKINTLIFSNSYESSFFGAKAFQERIISGLTGEKMSGADQVF